MLNDNTRFLLIMIVCVAIGYVFRVETERPAHADDSPNSASILERMVAHQKDMADSQKSVAKSLERVADKCK